MTMTYKAYSARNPWEIAEISKNHNNLQVPLQLSQEELRSSASRWKLRHLIAFRLVNPPECHTILEADHDQCPVCSDSQSPQKMDETRTQALVGPTPRNLHMKTVSELLALEGGAFWVALARVTACRPDQTREHPQRERKQVNRGAYVDSTSAIPGSSSSTYPSSSEYDGDADTNDVDEDEHQERGSKPEEVTVDLIFRFLEQALGVCLLQHRPGLAVNLEVRPRLERRRTTAKITTGATATAEDDGGICQMRRVTQGWVMDNPYLAVLEAKRAFQHFGLDENGNYVPLFSNENLAQCLGEAIIIWKENTERRQHGVFLLQAVNSFMRFSHFKFGCDYEDFLDAADVEAQLQIANDEARDACVYMESTRWLNLQSSQDRKAALCHLLALLRWHDQATGYDSEEKQQNGG